MSSYFRGLQASRRVGGLARPAGRRVVRDTLVMADSRDVRQVTRGV